jgi:hypothetical protein
MKLELSNYKITQSDLDEIISGLANIIECSLEVGKKIAALMDREPETINLLAELSGLGKTSFETLLRVGRGQLHPRLAFAEKPGLVYLAKCDVSVQEKYLTDMVEVLLADGETMLMKPDSLSLEQARQVFPGPRSPGEQRAWLEAQKSKLLRDKDVYHYKIRNGKVTFANPVKSIPLKLLREIAEAARGL